MTKKLAVLLSVLPKVALAGGVLNILLAGAIATLTVSASPSSITYAFPSANLTSSSATCTGAGGVPPYSYAWSWASGGTGIIINSASSSSTSFTVTGATVNSTYTGTAHCTATDMRPVTSPFSGVVSISMSRIPLLPPFVGTATMVAGQAASETGYDTNAQTIGSLSPSTDYNGNPVAGVFCHTGSLTLEIPQLPPNQFYITTLSVNGTLYAESSASFSYTAPYATWTWTSAASCPFINGSSYPVYYY